MEEEKFYLTMSAVGSPDEIVKALNGLITSMKTTPIPDMPKLTTHGILCGDYSSQSIFILN